MSFLSKFKSFFEAVGSEIEKLFGKNATFEQKVEQVIVYAAPLLETIVQLAAGSPAEAIVASVIARVQGSLATVSALVQQGTAAAGTTTAASVATALNSFKANLGDLLADASVKNSATASKIETTVNLLISEAEAVLSSLPAATPATPAA